MTPDPDDRQCPRPREVLRCAVLDDVQEAVTGIADWSPVADRVELTAFPDRFGSQDELAEALADFDIVVALRERVAFPARLFARLPRLRLLVAAGMHHSVIDYSAAERRGVTVCGTSSSVTPPVELTWALLLGVAQGVVPESTAPRGGSRRSTAGADLNGRVLGLLGLGRVAAPVARMGLAFGMDVVAWSRNLTDERAAEVGVRRAASLAELLGGSDFVSVHLALGERTRGLLGAAELALMKPGACLVNTSRAAIVDRDALSAALTGGRLAGAAVDVLDEPLPADHPLHTAPGLLATPHPGYGPQHLYRRCYGEAVEDIAAFLDGEPIRRLG
ncbi:D-2-hydroxyacid dehydrogenase family protein [Kitasatospora sp. NPDC004745]|uniref:D-2-hydroxyacid dehydrogenase family protein n=1 Tax=Kitasatospora sp. NPDC004745 TaxID=3364019 RepID=UPI0036941921